VCPPACPEELSSMPSLKHRKSRKGICFVPAAECRPSVPSKRGRFPISERTPRRSVLTPGVVEFCADGPGEPFSNSHGLETIPHSTTHHVLSTSQNRCYCGHGALSSMSSSYDPPQTTRFPSPLGRPGVPTTTLAMLFIRLIFEDPFTSPRAPCGLDPTSKIQPKS
jgi:hypothetical protein